MSNIRVYDTINEFQDIPYQGLKLLHSPSRTLETDKGLQLGDNIVKNGKFKDFTFDNNTQLEDMITNGNMENTGTWSGWNSPTTYERSSDQAYTGTYSWKIVTGALAGYKGATQVVTCVVGNSYKLSGWLYSDGTYGVMLFAYDATMGYKFSPTVTVAAWTYVEVFFVAETTSVNIGFVRDSPTNDVTFYADNIVMHDVTVAGHWIFSKKYAEEHSNESIGNTHVARFNGIDRYLSIANAQAGDFDIGSGNFSIEVSFRVTDTTAHKILIDTWHATGDYYYLRINLSTGYMYLRVWDGTTLIEVTGNNSVCDGKLHHVIATVDLNGNATLYLDGELDNSAVDASALTSIDLAADFNIGRLQNTSQYFLGDIVNVKYYNAALTANQVERAYRGNIDTTNLVAHWRFSHPDTWLDDQVTKTYGSELITDADNSVFDGSTTGDWANDYAWPTFEGTTWQSENVLHLANDGNNGEYVQLDAQELNSQPGVGTKVRFRARIWAVSGYEWKLNITDAGGSEVEGGSNTAIGEWQILEVISHNGIHATNSNALYIKYDAAETVECYIDWVEIKQITAGEHNLSNNAVELINGHVGYLGQDWSRDGAEYVHVLDKMTMEVDTNGDGLADDWSIKIGTGTASIVTGNGFTGNAQRFEHNDATATYLRFPLLTISSSKYYRIKFKYRCNDRISVHNGIVFNIDTPNTGDAIEYNGIHVGVADNSISLRIQGHTTEYDGDWVEVDDFEIYELPDKALIPTGWDDVNDLHASATNLNLPIIPNLNALIFNGTSEYFSKTSGTNSDFDLGSAGFTIEAWFKSVDVSTEQYIINKRLGSSDQWFFRIASDRLYFFAEDGNVTAIDVEIDSGKIFDNTWHHIAIVTDRVTAQMYVDGVAVTTTTNTLNTNNVTFTSTFGVGARAQGDQSWLKGELAEVHFTKSNLSAATILDHYTNGIQMDANTKGYWVFNNRDCEVDTSDAGNDLTSNGFSTDYTDELTFIGSPTYKDADALFFNGTSNYLEIPSVTNPTDFNINEGSFTIEAWVKCADYTAATNQTVMSKYQDSSNSWRLRITDTGRISLFGEETNTTRLDAYTTTGLFIDEQWHHIAISFEYGSGNVSFYVDGVLDGSSTTATNAGNDLTNTGDVYIGYNGASDYFLGEITEVKFVRKALTADEIKLEYGAAKHWTKSGTVTVQNKNFEQDISSTFSTANYLEQTLSPEVGSMYRVDYDYKSTDRGYIRIFTTDNKDFGTTVGESHHAYGFFQAQLSSEDLRIISEDVQWDNISVRKVLNPPTIHGDIGYAPNFSHGFKKHHFWLWYDDVSGIGDSSVDLGSDVLSVAINWTIAFRCMKVSNVGHCFVAGGYSGRNIGYTSSTAWEYRDGGSTYHYFDGTGNTVDTDSLTPPNSKYMSVVYRGDGTNVHLYLDGVYYGYATGSDSAITLRYLIHGYSQTIHTFTPDGIWWDWRIWDVDVGDAEALKYHNDVGMLAPKHWYKMIDNYSTTVLDEGTDGTANGTITGEVVDSVNAGVFDYDPRELKPGYMVNSLEDDIDHPYALTYDGVDQYVETNYVIGNKPVSIMWSWFKTDSLGSYVLMGSQTPTERNYLATYNSNVAGGLGATSWTTIHGTTTIEANTWYFVALVWNNGDWEIFLNGESDGSGTYTGNISLVSVHIGADNNNGTPTLFVPGKIGDSGIHVFDGENGVPSALPPDYENWIKRIYNSTEWKYEN